MDTKQVEVKEEEQPSEIINAKKDNALQNKEKEKLTEQLIISNAENAKQAAEAIIVNAEKAKAATEFIIANKEFVFSIEETAKRAEELIIANKELSLQKAEKARHTEDLIIANKRLTFQNDEIKKLAAEADLLVLLNEAQHIAKIGSWEWDLKSGNIWWSDEMFNIFEVDKGEFKQHTKSIENFLYPEDRKPYLNEFEKMKSPDSILNYDFRIVTAKGNLKYCNTIGKVHFDKEGKRDRISGALLDITERVRYAENEKRVADLIMTNKELEQFAYLASHDLQEPLLTISNYVELIAGKYSGKLDKEADQYLNFISTANNKIRNLIKDLLDFSSIGKENTFTSVDCNEILKEVIDEMGTSIKESNAKIKVSILPILTGDKIKLKQLFQNLIGNAIKFQKNNVSPEIKISVLEKDKEYIFAIKDNGIGIEEEYFDKLFKVFHRLHNVTEYPGTGIGLAISKKIVAQHYGKIWVESKIDEGSTFYFSIAKKLEKTKSL